MSSAKIVVLISGRGSNLQALIDAATTGELSGTIAAVISNQPKALGLQRAARAGIPTEILAHRAFPDRDSYDRALLARIDTYTPAVVALAGFMRLLTPAFVNHFLGRLLNIHPALLPRHKGLNTHKRVLAAGEAEHGASVHFVTADMDDGPVILQARVPVYPDDDEGRLAARVLEQEHRIYPLAIRWLIAGRIAWTNGQIYFDQQPLTRPLQLHEIDGSVNRPTPRIT